MILLFLFGITFAMNVPVFESREAAVYWANSQEYNKLVYRHIKKQIKQLKLVTSLLGENTDKETAEVMGNLMGLAERYELALEVLKAKKVGASVYCVSEPI